MGKKVDIREMDKDDVPETEDDGFEGLGEHLFDGGAEARDEVDKDDKDESSDEKDDAGRAVPEQAASDKKTWKTITPRQKAVNVIMRRAGREKPLTVAELMAGKFGTSVRIRDIAIFIGDEQIDEVMAEIAKECPLRNRVNLSAEVVKKRVLDIGAMIVEAGRMYQPISVARISDDGRLECTSGRHRLVFLALMFGPDVKVPVYLEEMTLSDARNAVVVANDTRATKAMERAEHTVLQAVRGNLDATQDDLYYRTVTRKGRAKRYCVFSVVNRNYPMKLSFSVSKDSSRKNGELTTLANVESYWGSALEWRNGMERKDFDSQLKDSTRFLNAVVAAMQKQKGFDAKQHVSAMSLTAVGKYYRKVKEGGNNPLVAAEPAAKHLVGMGDIGRQKSEKTYQSLMMRVGAPKK